MKLEEILQAIREGKRVRRKGWMSSSRSVVVDKESIDADDWFIEEDYEQVGVWQWVYWTEAITVGRAVVGRNPVATMCHLTEQEANEKFGRALIGRIQETHRKEMRAKK